MHKVVLELRGEVGDVSSCVLAYDQHLAKMGFGLSVALEAVLIATLLLADLTVPSQTLKSFGLHLVGDVLRSTDCNET